MIVEILFFAAMIIVAVFFIISLNKITSSVKNIERDVTDASAKITPLVADINIVIRETSEAVHDISEITENIRQDYNGIRPAIKDISQKAVQIGSTLGKIKDGTVSVSKFLFPVLSGVSAGLKFLKK